MIVCTLAAVGAVAGVVAWFAKSMGAGVAPTVVRVEPAGSGALVEIVSVPGEVQPEQKVQIGARVSAQILDLPHREGDTVTRHEARRPANGGTEATTRPAESSVLVRLDARDLESSLRSAEARAAAQAAEIDVARARVESQRSTIAASAATLADAERELYRQTQLRASDDVSQQAVDQAKTKVDELSATLQSARHSLAADEAGLIVLAHNLEASRAEINKAREQLAYTVITSPIDGTVIKVNSKVGENVVPGIQGSPGSVILEVADLSRMLMIGRVDEASVAQVAPGQTATVRMQAYRDERFEGTVQSVALAKADSDGGGGSAAARARSGGGGGSDYYEARILLKTDGRRILTGLTADADIETKRHENGVKVPSQAVVGRAVDTLPDDLRKRPEVEAGKQFASVVFRHVNGKAVATPVKVGPSDETHTLILSGLNAGEPVVVGPYKTLEAIQHDQVVKAEAAAATTKPVTQEGGEKFEARSTKSETKPNEEMRQ